MAVIGRTVMVLSEAIIKFADDEAGLTTADEYQCVVTSAALTATPNLKTIPATGCAPESQAPAATGWTLELTWLQDWTGDDGGLSFWAYTNDTLEKAFSITPNNPSAPPVATGTVRVVAGPYLGQFGEVLTATASWPVQGTPVITAPTALAAASSSSSE